jgi:hypothetical protein
MKTKIKERVYKLTFGNSELVKCRIQCFPLSPLLHGECALTAVLHTNPKNTYASKNNIKI